MKQLGCVYGYMKKCPLDSLLSLGVASYDRKVRVLCEAHGMHKWLIHRHDQPVEKVFPPEAIVYLSPDAEHVLDDLNANDVYVVGGIVDRSVRKVWIGMMVYRRVA